LDTGTPLIQTRLHSPQGLQVRRRHQSARRAMFEVCAEAAVPVAGAPVGDRAAAVLRVLYSAASWGLLDMQVTVRRQGAGIAPLGSSAATRSICTLPH
jgi:hypothetical protein